MRTSPFILAPAILNTTATTSDPDQEAQGGAQRSMPVVKRHVTFGDIVTEYIFASDSTVDDYVKESWLLMGESHSEKTSE